MSTNFSWHDVDLFRHNIGQELGSKDDELVVHEPFVVIYILHDAFQLNHVSKCIADYIDSALRITH